MIREQNSPAPLFYATDEIAMPARQNFYLRLREALDWPALAAPFAPAFSADRGRPTDPAVYLKIFLVSYLENISYDTDLAERIGDSLAIREFLGYDLTEAPPDHSSISRVRAHIGECCEVDEVLERVVQACIQARLVGGREGTIDSSLVSANASLSSLRSLTTGKSVREHLRAVRERNRQQPKGAPQEALVVGNEEFRSSTDGDARVAKKAGSPRDMSYKATQVIDSQAGIILAAGCERADVGETAAAEPLLAEALAHMQTAQQLEGRPEQAPVLVADAGYDAGEFHAAIEELGGEPLTNWQRDTRKPAGVQKIDFSYDQEQDAYRCPTGCWLRRRGRGEGRRHYVSRKSDCAACARRGVCCSEQGVRHISRGPHDASRERVIERCRSAAGQAALARRKGVAEPAFGHMKTYGGLGLINCRGWAKAHVKIVMAAVARNLTKLVKVQGAMPAGLASLAGPLQRLRALLRRLLGPTCQLWRPRVRVVRRPARIEASALIDALLR